MDTLPRDTAIELIQELRDAADRIHPADKGALRRVMELAKMLDSPETHGPEIVKELIELEARRTEEAAKPPKPQMWRRSWSFLDIEEASPIAQADYATIEERTKHMELFEEAKKRMAQDHFKAARHAYSYSTKKPK